MAEDVELAESLREVDRTRLLELEQIVERGLQTFVEVGVALTEIRESRLYRETHATFEAYCDDRWGFSDRRARQLMQAAQVGTMVPVGNERQAREFARLESEEDVVAVWKEARERYGERVTANDLRALVDARRTPGEDDEFAELRRLQDSIRSSEAEAVRNYWAAGNCLLALREELGSTEEEAVRVFSRYELEDRKLRRRRAERARACIRIATCWSTEEALEVAILTYDGVGDYTLVDTLDAVARASS